MAGSRPTSAPAPGRAPLPAPNAAALLRSNAADPEVSQRVAVRFGDRTWTHAEYVDESLRWAVLFATRRADRDLTGEAPATSPDPRPLHVGVLLDNTPDYLFALGGAALAGATIVGLNHTRAGTALARDLEHTDVDVVVTEPAHLDDLREGHGTWSGPVLVSGRFQPEHEHLDIDALGELGGRPLEDLDDAVAGAWSTEAADSLPQDLDPRTRWALIFTSGTSSAPKAVVCSHRRLLGTASRLRTIMGIGPDDVGYVCMPLFHSNALMVGWAPSLVAGCAVALARRFSASRWLDDVRRYGATYFNYTGKPLSYLVATEERPDDADNPLRVAFGNEGSPAVVESFSRRFGVEVIDAFGSTEGAIALDRDVPPRRGSVGRAGPHISVVDEHDRPCPPARFDPDGTPLNAAECVGEIVSTAGSGPFEGYYNNAEATDAATRGGWYRSGDLGYLDEDRYLYFAGRTSDWLRVDGENFPSGPIDEALARHPDVVLAVAYGVPDVHAGDQVMATLLLREGTDLDPTTFGEWVDRSSGLPPKWRPRYLRVAADLPTTGTNKVLKRALAGQKYRRDQVGDDQLYVRDRGAVVYRRFTPEDEAALHTALAEAGRARFWDL